MSTELGGAIPVPPAIEDESPHYPLRKAHDDLNLSDAACNTLLHILYLVPQCDPRNALPSLSLLDTLQVALFESEIGQRWHVLLPRYRIQDTKRDLILAHVRVLVEVGKRIDGNGLLLGCSSRRVEVVSR